MVLKPRTDTYLNAEWDEVIPFPTIWKLRFNGYGMNTYDWDAMYTGRIPNDPLYQPQGASHFGGSFADTVCLYSAAGNSCKCAQVKAAAPAQELAKAPPAQAPTALGVQVEGYGLPSAPLSHA
ncbi:hypothetical protein OEA41_005912 [Lepraria neglecta]|uniref:Uncharacterized protein n=1 Tax=Lepraria neglecta TaxID=209136 RepID=A0AAE0DMM0_9LECA|nr:hypothetical protein OEA41_005912 [Lepraria neglecta]